MHLFAIKRYYSTRCFYFTAATIKFNQSWYSIVEGNKPVKPTLVLSNPSSTVITIQVGNVDGNATGKYEQELFIL